MVPILAHSGTISGPTRPILKTRTLLSIGIINWWGVQIIKDPLTSLGPLPIELFAYDFIPALITQVVSKFQGIVWGLPYKSFARPTFEFHPKRGHLFPTKNSKGEVKVDM